MHSSNLESIDTRELLESVIVGMKEGQRTSKFHQLVGIETPSVAHELNVQVSSLLSSK